MKKAKVAGNLGEMQAEYRREDFGPMVRGKYAKAYREASNVVVIAPATPALEVGIFSVHPRNADSRFLCCCYFSSGLTRSVERVFATHLSQRNSLASGSKRWISRNSPCSSTATRAMPA